jgi:pimeloyl-ACP methyl ester carboxylesterase
LQGGSLDRPLVLYFHGNAENLETLRRSGLFGDFDRTGADLLALDYPGYGRSAGEPSEAANLAAAEAALAWAVREHPDQPRIVCGWSLGAAVAIQLAARHPEAVDRLILLSPWSTLRALAGEHYPAFLVGALLRERYDSLAAAASIRCPTLVVHGEADTIIPIRHGEALARALGERARFVAMPDAGHNDLLAEAGTWSEIREFLSSPDRCQSIAE